jgi:hypothetical protein
MGMESLFWSIDFSKGIFGLVAPELDFTVPSEHTQEGKRYWRANVQFLFRQWTSCGR